MNHEWSYVDNEFPHCKWICRKCDYASYRPLSKPPDPDQPIIGAGILLDCDQYMVSQVLDK